MFVNAQIPDTFNETTKDIISKEFHLNKDDFKIVASIQTLFLKDSVCNNDNFVSFTDFIDTNISPNSQRVLIEKNGQFFDCSLTKDEDKHDSIIQVDKMGLPPDSIIHVVGNSINEDKMYYPHFLFTWGKYLVYYRDNENAMLFYICGMPLGLWSIKDGKIYKVNFRRSFDPRNVKYKEYDANDYYERKVKKMSPDGINCLNNSLDFYPVEMIK